MLSCVHKRYKTVAHVAGMTANLYSRICLEYIELTIMFILNKNVYTMYHR